LKRIMTSRLPKPDKIRPWTKCAGKKGYLLLKPGWAGFLDDDELAYIQEKLRTDPALAFSWGFRPGQKSRAAAAIRRVAMYGEPDCRAANVKLARSRPEPSQISHDKAA